jgi:uncharacterized protein (DUF1015 family)
MYEDPSRSVATWLDEVAASTAPVADIEADGGRHRLWAVPAGEDTTAITAAIGRDPVTIADGHHRYETALRYRDERRRGAGGAAGPWDDLLALFLEPIAGPIAVLATHRVVRGLGDDGVAGLLAALPRLFDVRDGVGREELTATFAPAGGATAVPAAAGGGNREPAGGRFGLWTRARGGAMLRARLDAVEALLPPGGDALRRLDVTLLGAALEALVGLDPATVDGGGRIAYTKDAEEAIRWVDEAREGADAAFLLDPTPAAEIVAVAAAGDVMPQKSTYIYPKALTGLVINPLE